MKKAIAVVLGLIMLVSLSACGEKSAIYGEWEAYNEYGAYGFPDRIEFLRDGTCIADGADGEYTTDNGRLWRRRVCL